MKIVCGKAVFGKLDGIQPYSQIVKHSQPHQNMSYAPLLLGFNVTRQAKSRGTYFLIYMKTTPPSLSSSKFPLIFSRRSLQILYLRKKMASFLTDRIYLSNEASTDREPEDYLSSALGVSSSSPLLPHPLSKPQNPPDPNYQSYV